jgi:hypothetical protein
MFAGDLVAHWNWGTGLVLNAAPTREEVPEEWQHDWQSVVLVQFPEWHNACVWVLAAFLDPITDECE